MVGQMDILHVLLPLLCTIYPSIPAPTEDKSKDFYLLISFDGFRWDYLDIVKSRGRETPNFDFLIKTGVKAEYMKGAFVSHTWPNHWTIATGMHVESHGVVANTFYDPVLDAMYDGPRTPESYWYNNGTDGTGGEPLWLTYQRSSPENHAAVAVWPGSTTTMNGKNASYMLPQKTDIPFTARVDAIVQWFTQSEDPAHLGFLYFDEPDRVGHDEGPLSKAVEDKIVELDGIVGYIMDRFREKDLLSKLNLIITSDHGMTDLNVMVKLSDYISPDIYTLSGDGPVHQFLPNPGKTEEVLEALSKIPNSTVLLKEEIPRRLFYNYNRRIMPIMLMMDEGFMTCCYNGTNRHGPAKGEHGYDNELQSMRPFFIAHGPAFRSGISSPPFNNTDIYPLLCHLLDIEPYPNNGSLDNIRHILKGQSFMYAGKYTKSSLSTVATSAISFCIMFAITVLVLGVYFLVIRKPTRGHFRTPVELTIEIPTSHSDAQEDQNDRKWLLQKEVNENSDSDLEEWMPLKNVNGSPNIRKKRGQELTHF